MTNEPIKYYVYEINCTVNNKKYIGFTAKGIEERLHKHHINALANRASYFYNAMRKHGIDNFNIRILWDGFDRDRAYILEKRYIKFWQSRNNSYNLAKGGTGGNTRMFMGEEQLKDYHARLSIATTCENNPRWLGRSDEDIITMLCQLSKDYGKVLPQEKWQIWAKKHRYPQTFSKNRFGGKYKNLTDIVQKRTGLKYHCEKGRPKSK